MSQEHRLTRVYFRACGGVPIDTAAVQHKLVGIKKRVKYLPAKPTHHIYTTFLCVLEESPISQRLKKQNKTNFIFVLEIYS